MKPEKVAKSRNNTKKTLKADLQTKENSSNWQGFTSSPERSSRSTTSSSQGSINSPEEAFVECFTDEKDKSERESNIDICALAEKCVLEEIEHVEHHKELNTAVQAEPVPHSYCTSRNKMIPVLDLTFEEEFKIHELEAMKENLLDGCFKIYLEFPNFLKCFSSVFSSLSLGVCPVISTERVLSGQNYIRNYILNPKW